MGIVQNLCRKYVDEVMKGDGPAKKSFFGKEEETFHLNKDITNELFTGIKDHLVQEKITSDEHRQRFIEMVKENISNRLLNHKRFDNQVRKYEKYHVSYDPWGSGEYMEKSVYGTQERF